MSASSNSGGDFLDRKSGLNRARASMPKVTDVLVVDDETADADRLRATLRVMFGYDVGVRSAATVGKAVDLIVEKKPDVVFLDDVLKPSDDATKAIPYLRRAGFDGPIIVVSGQVTRSRRAALTSAGATEIIHKDEVDSVRLAEALHRVFGSHGG